MKSHFKQLTLSLLLSSTLLGACTSAPANNTPSSPAAPAAPATPAVDASADLQVAVTRISEKAFNSQTFSQELQANPKAVLAAEGISLAANEQVKVVDFLNAEGKVYMILDDRNLERFYGEQIKHAPSDAEADETLKTFRAIRAKAQSDATFKASLLVNPATVLAAEGLNAEAAKKFEVLDFEADTHFLLILPPDQQVTRSSLSTILRPVLTQVINSLRPITEQLGEYIIPHLQRGLLKIADPLLPAAEQAKQNEAIQAVDIAVDGIYYASEGACFWVRFFGGSCGVSRQEIAAAILAEL